MSEKKVYLLMKSSIPPHLIEEFNEYWLKESLPFWQKHGARLIGAFVNYVGGPICEEIRLFEFDSIAHWDQFEQSLAISEEGQELVKRLLSRFNIVVERRLLRAIYDIHE
jgi:hypothetical protein